MPQELNHIDNQQFTVNMLNAEVVAANMEDAFKHNHQTLKSNIELLICIIACIAKFEAVIFIFLLFLITAGLQLAHVDLGLYMCILVY